MDEFIEGVRVQRLLIEILISFIRDYHNEPETVCSLSPDCSSCPLNNHIINTNYNREIEAFEFEHQKIPLLTCSYHFQVSEYFLMKNGSFSFGKFDLTYSELCDLLSIHSTKLKKIIHQNPEQAINLLRRWG